LKSRCREYLAPAVLRLAGAGGVVLVGDLLPDELKIWPPIRPPITPKMIPNGA